MTTPPARAADADAAQPSPLERARLRLGRARLPLLGIAVFVLLLALAVSWTAVRGLLARSHLRTVQNEITALDQALRAGDRLSGAALRARVNTIGTETAAARKLTGDPLWALTVHVPTIGCPARSVRSMVTALDQLLQDSRPLLDPTGSVLDLDALRTGTTIDTGRIAAARPAAASTHAAISQFHRRLAATPSCGAIGARLGLADAREAGLRHAERLERAAATLELVTRLVPPMMGADGPRRYLLVVQNPAESRATGGIIGAFGLLTAVDGRLGLTGISGNGYLPGGPTQRVPAMALPPELEDMYADAQPTQVWANANLTPHYPTVGSFYTALYQAGTGVRVDGTISIDPTTLSYLLAATKPAVLPGGRSISAGSLVELVESRAYAEIGDVWQRDAFFASVGRAVYDAVASGAGNTSALLSALGRAATEGRLLVSSNHPAEQEILETTALGGALPDGDGPYLAVVTQNAAASKLDYWLRRNTDYRSVRRPDGSADVTITIRLTNAAPAGLSAYVRNRSDQPVPGQPGAGGQGAPPAGNPDAQNLLSLAVYTGVGSGLQAATLDGLPVHLHRDAERGHPVLSTPLPLDRGQTRTLVLRIWEPVARATLLLRPQPLAVPETVTTSGIRSVSPWSRNPE
ncbi:MULTISPECIES: DUF4012 domain-containing protein [Protofrankia]|uniref:Beta-glucan endohydrolase n=1 Tax=Candidatus Protofrankia datiscae TaxID=2716812 RepID=F8AZI2_9ACTN|nr:MULTISPECIES: DUF4012 domain-containing protein [Protofrankia]AEH08657.1 beta-glucan endohydrolase [Candidatus Protofrankia datiscae]